MPIIIAKPRQTNRLFDSRLLQLLIMGSLLLFGVAYRDFSLQAPQIILTFSAGMISQAVFLRLFKQPQANFLSCLISCLGLCLLLRSNHLWVHPLTACLMISSKFLIRPSGRHLFNPANLGVILGISLCPNTWITSGQWGADLSTALWLIAGGFLVARNAYRLDITAYFLGFYSLIFISIRILYYGYDVSVYLHQFQNGTLLLFAFFMISDPMTSPKHKLGRLIHALLVASIAYVWQYYLYWHQGIIWGLFIATFLVPFWNKILPAPVYQWNSRHA